MSQKMARAYVCARARACVRVLRPSCIRHYQCNAPKSGSDVLLARPKCCHPHLFKTPPCHFKFLL